MNILVFILFIIVLFFIDKREKFATVNKAVCVLTNNDPGITGKVTFEEMNNTCKITVEVDGLSPGKHGFHIHNKGDLTEGCKNLFSHFNPFGKNHGGLNSKEKHVGDLGNVISDANKKVRQVIYADDIKLNGPISVIGRSVVIHEDEDDLGLGGNEESLKTGNAGKRIACGVIGIS